LRGLPHRRVHGSESHRRIGIIHVQRRVSRNFHDDGVGDSAITVVHNTTTAEPVNRETDVAPTQLRLRMLVLVIISAAARCGTLLGCTVIGRVALAPLPRISSLEQLQLEARLLEQLCEIRGIENQFSGNDGETALNDGANDGGGNLVSDPNSQAENRLQDVAEH
jgi:hypothetical protein